MSFLPASRDEGLTAGRHSMRFDGRMPMAKLSDGLLLALATAFLISPLLSVLVAGLRADLPKLVGEPVFWQAAAMSCGISLSAATLALVVSAALIRARQTISADKRSRRGSRALYAAMGGASSMVLLAPPVVLATGWFMALRPFGDASVFAPVLVVLINMLMALPFVMRVLEPAYLVHQRRTARLAASLGLTGLARLRLIDWPGLRKPLLTALSFAMALSLGDLGAVALFGSDGFVTLPWLVYSRMGSYRTNDADGLALILGVICLLLTIAGTSGQMRGHGADDGR
jgi:thiamine transport system permease protein